MRRLSVFLLTLLISSGTALASTYCADISNTWTTPNSPNYCGGYPCSGNQSWSLLQNADGSSISGKVDNYFCSGADAYITLTVDNTTSKSLGNGSYLINTNTVDNCTYGATITLSGTGCT